MSTWCLSLTWQVLIDRQAGKPDVLQLETAGSCLMNPQGWAMRLDRRDVAAAGRLRQVAGVEVCEQADAVWLRGPQSGEELHWQLAAVPGARRFSVLSDGQLLPAGARVPQGRLPQG